MRIAVDGIDCAGRTTLADRLGGLLQASRISIDDCLRPPAERHARGELSPEGYYRDSHDLAAFRRASTDLPPPASFELALERRRVRDVDRMADVRRRCERRYFPGQRLYPAEVDPRRRADVVAAA